MIIQGVGNGAEIVTNAAGAKQSATQYRLDLMPPLALLNVAEVLKYGADKYGDNNWHAIPIEDHLNHALVHAYAYLAGDTQDNHLRPFCVPCIDGLRNNIVCYPTHRCPC